MSSWGRAANQSGIRKYVRLCANKKFSLTLLVSRSEYPRDKSFLLIIVSSLRKKIKIKREKREKIAWALSELPANWPGLTSHFGWGRPGQLAGKSERAHAILSFLIWFLFISLNTKPLSVEMVCLLGIQNEIQAVCSA